MLFRDVMFDGIAKRQEAIEEARAAGRMGAQYVPPGALTAVPDPSDTFIGKLEQARLDGAAQREAPKTSQPTYSQWLATHFDRLERECMESPAEDKSRWLQQQFRIETGCEP